MQKVPWDLASTIGVPWTGGSETSSRKTQSEPQSKSGKETATQCQVGIRACPVPPVELPYGVQNLWPKDCGIDEDAGSRQGVAEVSMPSLNCMSYPCYHFHLLLQFSSCEMRYSEGIQSTRTTFSKVVAERSWNPNRTEKAIPTTNLKTMNPLQIVSLRV